MKTPETVTDSSNTKAESLEIQVHDRAHNSFSAVKLPKSNDRVSFRTNLEGHDVWYEGTVIGKAGKSTGENKYFLNIIYDAPDFAAGQSACVNWEKDVEEWKTLENHAVVLMAESGDRFFEAKMKELESWRANNVYDVVDQESLNCIGVRWVLTEKNGLEKARLVAKGYQDENAPLDKSLVDSPTCSKESVRTILNVMAVKSWTPHSLDVKSAFLQGQPIKRHLFEASTGSRSQK